MANIGKTSTTTPAPNAQNVSGTEQSKPEKKTQGAQGVGHQSGDSFSATTGSQPPKGVSTATGAVPPAPATNGDARATSGIPKWILEIKNDTPYQILRGTDGKLRLQHKVDTSDSYLISINPSNSFHRDYNEAMGHCIGSLLNLVAAHGQNNGGIKSVTFTGNHAAVVYSDSSAPQQLGGDANKEVPGEEIRKNLKLLGDVLDAIAQGHQGGGGTPTLEMYREAKEPKIDLNKEEPVVQSEETARAHVAGPDDLSAAVGAVAKDAEKMLKDAWLATRQLSKVGSVEQQRAALQDIVKKKENYEGKLEELKAYKQEPSQADRTLHARVSNFINKKTTQLNAEAPTAFEDLSETLIREP